MSVSSQKKDRPKPHNPYQYMSGHLRDHFEETTTGFRYEDYRTYGPHNRQASLRRALDVTELHMWQIITAEGKIHYFDRHSEALRFLGQNGYLPKPKGLFNIHF
jgi:hypothetical protein